jgi:hypothetical protein
MPALNALIANSFLSGRIPDWKSSPGRSVVREAFLFYLYC